MKKALSSLVLTLSLGSAAMALELKGLQIDIQRVSFTNDKGQATARDIYAEIGSLSSVRKQNRKSTPQELYIYRDEAAIRLETGFLNLGWNKIPKWLTSDLNLQGQDLKLKLGYAPTNEITARTLTVNKPGLGTADLNNLRVVCTPESQMNADFEKIVPQCLEKSVITASEVSLPSLLDAFRDMGIDEQLDKSDDYTKVGNGLEITVLKGMFNLKLTLATPIIQKFIKLVVTASGEAKLDEKTNVLRLRIDEARLKNFKLTRFIPAVAAVLFPKEVIRVDGPYLYVSLNDPK